MLSHSGILLLIILGPVRAGVKCQRSNEVFSRNNFENDADGETFPPLSTADNSAVGNEEEFDGKNFKLPEKFHPENDRDADPVEGMKKKTKKKSEPSARKYIAKMVSFSDESTVTDSAEDLSAFSSKNTTLKKEKKKKTKNHEEKKNFKTKTKPSIEKPENIELEGEEENTTEQPEPKRQELNNSKKLKHLKSQEKNLNNGKPENPVLEDEEEYSSEQSENGHRKLSIFKKWKHSKNKKPSIEKLKNFKLEGEEENTTEQEPRPRELNNSSIKDFKTKKKHPRTEKPENLKLETGEEYIPEQLRPRRRELDNSNKLKHLKGKEKNLNAEEPENLVLKDEEENSSEQSQNDHRILGIFEKWNYSKDKKPSTEKPENFEWEDQRENPAQDRQEVKNPEKVKETERTTAKQVMDGNKTGPVEPEREMQISIGFGEAKESEGTTKQDPTSEKPKNFEDVSLQPEPRSTGETKDFKLSYDIELSPGKVRILTVRMNLNNLMQNLRKTKISVLI